MKILVISDTHGNTRAVEEAITHNSDTDIILHLGDGINDIKRAERNNVGFIAVKGNCDGYDAQEEHSLSIEIEGKKIFMTHGHKFSAKTTKELLLSTALNEGADICLFGHTHCRYDESILGIRMLNPGSLGHDGNYITILLDRNIGVEFKKIP